MSGGKKAFANGKKLECDFRDILVKNNFITMLYRDFSKIKNKNENYLVKNIPYITIYGTKGRSEFLIYSNKYSLNHRVECKEQNVGGSVDEKLPYLLHNCLETFEEKNIIIIHRGNGFKKGAIDWLKNKAIENKSIKNIEVFTLQEFNVFLKNNLKIN